MKYLQISTVMAYGSIGRIMRQNYDEKKAEGWECLIAYGRGEAVVGYNSVRIGTDWDVFLQGMETRLFDKHGYGSKIATKKFLKQVEQFQPDIVHLHNIHGYYINFEMLFQWLKKHPECKVWWTLHDCWAFTGHCSYFTLAKCEKWKEECGKCCQLRSYPTSFFTDNTKNNYNRKKNSFCGVRDMTLITPSQWLACLVKQSFLKEYDVIIKYNTIDTGVFKPTPSCFREKYGIENKKIILGVASVWEKRKGLEDFIELARKLGIRYQIVLVGLSEKQMKQLPSNIIGLSRTNSARELAEIYSTADLFVNPTYEDNFPTVNLEAEACGTPVVTYDTGGAPETITRYNSRTVPTGDIETLFKEIERILEFANES